MKVKLKDNLIVIIAETTEEKMAMANWGSDKNDHAFALRNQKNQTFLLTDLGSRLEVCQTPINITSRAPDPAIQLISNFAHTPFVLDDRRYASVEGFWQGLKFPEAFRRREVAHLHGGAARRAGQAAPVADTLTYGGNLIRIGTYDHWRLMAAACWAKFSQHPEAQQALIKTGTRPLEHRVRRDSRTIPGVIMAQIWMRIRRTLTEGGNFDT